jgi:signal transduction histidine kinase
MPRFSLSSLRSRAIVLVLIAILPVLALTLYSYFDQRHQAIHEVQRDELVTARNLATLQEVLIRDTRQLLMTLARLPQMQRRDREGCNALFARMLANHPYYSALIAADPQGQLFASAPAVPGPVNFADRLWFQKVVQTRAFFISEPIQGRLTNKYVINLAYPILDEAGRLQGVVTAGLDLHWLGRRLVRSDFPPSTALGLVDAKGKVLFRYPEPQKYSGNMASDVLIKAMSSRDEGVAEGMGLPGDQRLFAFVRLSPPWQELLVAIGLPREWALARVNRELWRHLMWLAAVALLALAAARFGANIFIIQPLARLLAVTRRLSEGELTARSGAPYKAGELGQLAQAFDQMADSLQEREAELNQAAAALRQQISELHRRSLELAAVNKELENFTYSVAHDLRAPLRAMGGFARVLLEDYPGRLDAEGERYLHIIHQEARKMGQLIDDLLALARLGRKEMTLAAIDMDELVKSIIAESKAAHPQRNLQIDLQPLPEAWGDKVMLRQLLLNLLGNAIKFTQGREPALIEVSGWNEGRENIYGVKDNGVGFDMKYVDKLFEVFQRLHPEEAFGGTGVGLAIVKRVIDRHGGRVWAEGKVHEGASFYFAIPKRNGT